jgi:hypothetical protein
MNGEMRVFFPVQELNFKLRIWKFEGFENNANFDLEFRIYSEN